MNLATAGTRYLIDTNVLVRAARQDDALHQTAVDAVTRLMPSAALFVAPQNLIEFWAVATRPIESRGLGMTTQKARGELQKIKTAFRLLPDRAEVFTEWERIVTTYGVSGLPAHDARLVASMYVHGLTHILTFNTAHFRRYQSGENISVVEPASVK